MTIPAKRFAVRVLDPSPGAPIIGLFANSRVSSI